MTDNVRDLPTGCKKVWIKGRPEYISLKAKTASRNSAFKMDILAYDRDKQIYH